MSNGKHIDEFIDELCAVRYEGDVGSGGRDPKKKKKFFSPFFWEKFWPGAI